ncbi:TonB-dependent siderophore receptor [Myxosarcina sp. GI1(2024)]
MAAINPVAAEAIKNQSDLGAATQIQENRDRVSISAKDLLAQQAESQGGRRRGDTETGRLASFGRRDKERGSAGDTFGKADKFSPSHPVTQSLSPSSPSPLVPESPSQSSSINLIAQGNVTRVTGVQINPTESGLKLVLETVAGSERLVPLIVPEGNDLVIDILDATLAFSIRRGIEELNPAPGISRITVNKVDDSSIRVTITGTNQTPSAEIVPGRDDLVLSVTPEDTTAEQEPDEEIEVIATGEAEDEDDYFEPDATTGTRLDIPRLETPASIGIITEELIEDKAARRAEDLTPFVSGVSPSDGEAQGGLTPQFTIRGFGVNRQVYINGLRDSQRFLVRDLANIERIEILKGLSSLLYGTGTPGGVVNYITKKPESTPQYSASFQAGSFDFYRGEVDATGPITKDEKLLYRFVAAYQEANSFVDNVEDDRIFIAPSLTYLTGNNGSLTLEGEYYRQDKDINSGAKFRDGEFLFDRSYTDPRNSQINDNYRVAAYFDQPFSDDWKISLSGQYFHIDRANDPLSAGFFFNEEDELVRSYDILSDDFDQVNLRGEVTGDFKIGATEHKLLAGVEYSWSETNFTLGSGVFSDSDNTIDLENPSFDVPIPDVEFRDPFDEPFIVSISDWGIYLQDFVTWGRFRLLAGLRYGEFENTSNDEINSEGNFVSPTVGLVYTLSDSASIYASFSQSTEPQSGTTRDDEFIEPREATQYEIGTKVNLFDERFNVTAALFDLTQTNIAESDPADPEFVIPVGDVRTRGLELDLTGEITNNLSLILAYTHFFEAEVIASDEGLEGNSLLNAPSNEIGIYGEYEFTEGALRGLSLGTGLIYVDERAGDSDNTFDLPSYFRVDLGATYELNNLTFALAIENLFDETYASGSSDRANITQGRPFAVTGSVKVDF